jgi:hypothetical protein
MCVRAGSAKKATKALTDSRLKPALRLLEYAGSKSRDKQSLLMRDLKLGVNHIDRDQLRRNGLLSPRYPTSIRKLTASVEDTVQAEDIRGASLYGATGAMYRIRCSATIELIADERELHDSAAYRDENGVLGKVFQEDWIVYRSFKDFQLLHKHIKNQVSTSESSGTAGSRLVGAASAAFTASALMAGRPRQRKALVPSLSQATKVGALGITKKALVRRQECLNEYIMYLVAPGHLLNRCTEVMLFLGAFYPLPPSVCVGKITSGVTDPLGRCEMYRSILESHEKPTDASMPESMQDNLVGDRAITTPPDPSGTSALGTTPIAEGNEEDDFDGDLGVRAGRKDDMIPAIRNKVDKIPLPLVRNRIFELVRYQFGFDNASFVRNRMLTALKTASFAVTSQAEFHKLLYNLHKDHLSASTVAGYINMGTELLWPGGVFFTSAPPLTDEELQQQAEQARTLLHENFPEGLRTILGQELTQDGLDIFHEMLQNRLVVKSMAYMLFDLLWLEIFPEIGDVLAGGKALDGDSEKL